MKRIVAMCAASAALTLVAAAGAAVTGVIKLTPGSVIEFKGLTCAAKTTTYSYLVCASDGPYEVAVSKSSVIVVRARNGRIIYQTP